MSIVVGIDASRNRSGGAIENLVGILRDGDPVAHGIRQVHVWTYESLCDRLPDSPWLVRHSPRDLNRSLAHQVLWQARSLAGEVRRNGCDVLFTTDASTVCRFRPSVVMSQDMLSFEPGAMTSFRLSQARFRLIMIGFLQTRAMRRADGVVFLTKYAAEVIQRSTGKLTNVSIIPHGIDNAFRQTSVSGDWSETAGREIRCLYVSNAAMYKHQWVVVKAIGELRKRGHCLRLSLVGGGTGRARRLMDNAIAQVDPDGRFTECRGFLPHDRLPGLFADADLFVFASSCENLPVTLLEAMATGLPIACSNRGPMPEVLADGGVYFNPESVASIAAAIERLIVDRERRMFVASRAKELSEQYSWESCSSKVWEFLHATVSKCAHNA